MHEAVPLDSDSDRAFAAFTPVDAICCRWSSPAGWEFFWKTAASGKARQFAQIDAHAKSRRDAVLYSEAGHPRRFGRNLQRDLLVPVPNVHPDPLDVGES